MYMLNPLLVLQKARKELGYQREESGHLHPLRRVPAMDLLPTVSLKLSRQRISEVFFWGPWSKFLVTKEEAAVEETD
jgi:hypothetical protein